MLIMLGTATFDGTQQYTFQTPSQPVKVWINSYLKESGLVPHLSLLSKSSWGIFRTCAPMFPQTIDFEVTDLETNKRWFLSGRFDSELWNLFGLASLGISRMVIPSENFKGTRVTNGTHIFSLRVANGEEIESNIIVITYECVKQENTMPGTGMNGGVMAGIISTAVIVFLVIIRIAIVCCDCHEEETTVIVPDRSMMIFLALDHEIDAPIGMDTNPTTTGPIMSDNRPENSSLDN
jgi:hypothetical protein